MATLAILIASLGLLGRIVYSLEQRTKEIGIREVSGSTTINILMLISKEYTKLILVAFCIDALLRTT
jgi:putative ABC transport system permease protein